MRAGSRAIVVVVANVARDVGAEFYRSVDDVLLPGEINDGPPIPFHSADSTYPYF